MTTSDDDENDPSGVFDLLDAAEGSAWDRSRVVAGRYEILERLGEGGMGQVIRVRHVRLGKAFALKLMHAQLVLDPEAQALFRREARLASHLRHPNIVETIDFGEDPDWGWFIVMEYLEGEPLSARIDRLGALPVATACDVAAQLADALAHSHSRQVVHGDLKAENVLCLTADSEWSIKLLDFGTAQLATAARPNELISATPEYVAPERITGGPTQPSGDVYALGVILYEMLTGAPPFVGGDLARLLERHLTEVPEPAGARRGEVLDPQLDAILARSLAKDPAARYPTAQAMLDDLRAYLGVLGVRERTGTLAPRIARSVTRADAVAAAFDALRLPSAGLDRDGRIVVANLAFARFVGAGDVDAVEGRDVRATMLGELVGELEDALRVVAVTGEVVRRHFMLQRGDRQVRMRCVFAPATGPCGDCMLVLHST